MLREEFLKKVKDTCDLSSIRQADEVVRAVVAILKAELPPEQADKIASALPEDLRSGWETVGAYPADILEREDMYYDGAEAGSTEVETTITQG